MFGDLRSLFGGYGYVGCEVVDFISLRSGLTSALYRRVVSHTNYSGQKCQQRQRSRTALSALPAMLWQAGMQLSGVSRQVSCNSGYTKITPEIHIIHSCEVYGYTQVSHEVHLTYAKVALEARVLRSPFGAHWLQHLCPQCSVFRRYICSRVQSSRNMPAYCLLLLPYEYPEEHSLLPRRLVLTERL